MEKETYLGDGVYASYDGYHIVLQLSAQVPIHRIALEPQVIERLESYIEAVKEGDQSAQR